MRGVTGEEDASPAVALRQADVGPEHRRPADVVQPDAPVVGVVVDPPEDVVLPRRGFLVRRETDRPLEHVAAGQRTGADEPAAPAGPHVPPVAGQTGHRGVDDERPVALVRRPGEADAELFAHGAGTAVGAHHVAGDDLLRAVRARHLGDDRVLVLRQPGQLPAELDLAAELAEARVQGAVRAELGDEPGVGVGDVRGRLLVGNIFHGTARGPACSPSLG